MQAALALAGAAVLLASFWGSRGPFSVVFSGWLVFLSRFVGGEATIGVGPADWGSLVLVGVGTALAAAPLAALAHTVGKKPSPVRTATPALLLALVAGLGVPMAAESARTEGALGPLAYACMVAIALFGAWLIVTAVQLPAARRPWSPVVRWSLGCAGLGLAALVTIPLGLAALLVAYSSLAVGWLRPAVR